MKTVEEFYKQIVDSKELQEELKNVSDKMLESFLKKHDCNVSAKEFTEFVRSQNDGEIEDDDAAAVAGGAPMYGFRKCV